MGLRFVVRHFFLWRVPDYLAAIIIAVVAALVGAKVRPHCRAVDWSDPTIGHPFATTEVFPMYSVAIAVVFVAVVYVVGELCTRWRRPAGKLNMCLHLNGWVLTHVWSILLAFAFVNLTKLYAGRLRPDFLSRLARDGITETSWAAMSHAAQCRTAREGRLSFPSGHSGTAFSGYVPPCMYLMGLFRALNGGRLWLVTIALLPLILPITIAVSRTNDYRHNFDDILAGSICGALCGVFAVVLCFRPSTRGEWTLREHPDDVVGVAAAPASFDDERLVVAGYVPGNRETDAKSMAADYDPPTPGVPTSPAQHRGRREQTGAAAPSPREKPINSAGESWDGDARSRGSYESDARVSEVHVTPPPDIYRTARAQGQSGGGVADHRGADPAGRRKSTGENSVAVPIAAHAGNPTGRSSVRQ
ncbi:PAP2 superfamily [Novymonas esmeraldas]|uniref:PAP2 superfamily n=1 Tax=Novymonas esmeraldas TaxID=1808958 RepID=A0AAW0EVJ7_9TRYP